MRPRRSHGASHAGDGLGDYPRICSGCGDPVRITGARALFFETVRVNGQWVKRSYHADCLKKRPQTATI